MDRKMVSGLKYKKRAPNADSFLEALRDLGTGVVDSVVHDVVGGIAEEAIDQVSGKKTNAIKPSQTLKPGEWAEINKFDAGAIEKNDWGQERVEPLQREFTQIQQQERLLFKQSEQDTQLQIRGILEELKKLVASAATLAEEVEVAVQQAPVDPGVYHLSFFEKLRQTIILFKKRIEDSATWLAAFNQKAKKHNYYWGQVRKSETKFMLSQERYMSTQAG